MYGLFSDGTQFKQKTLQSQPTGKQNLSIQQAIIKEESDVYFSKWTIHRPLEEMEAPFGKIVLSHYVWTYVAKVSQYECKIFGSFASSG